MVTAIALVNEVLILKLIIYCIYCKYIGLIKNINLYFEDVSLLFKNSEVLLGFLNFKIQQLKLYASNILNFTVTASLKKRI